MAHSHAFSPFASSAVPGSLSFPPFSSPSVRPSSFFGVCWELFGETLRGVGIPSIQSRLWLSFRLPPFGSSGPVVAHPVFPRALFCLCASRFSGGPFTLLLEFLLTPSHRTVSPISRSFSASLAFEMCHVRHGHV